MTRALQMAVVLAASMGAAITAQTPHADELRKIEGGWIVVAAEQRGRPFEVIRGGGLVIEGTAFSLKTAAGNEFKGQIRVDPTKSPKQLDFVHDKEGLVWEAIYTVSDEAFRLNYVEAGGADKRPTLFATSTDTAGTVIVMNRMTRR